MNIDERLGNLSANVTRTFHKDFIFLVFPNKVQHFPARSWTKEQVLAKVHEYLGTNVDYDHWRDCLIATSPYKELIIMIPGFSSL